MAMVVNGGGMMGVGSKGGGGYWVWSRKEGRALGDREKWRGLSAARSHCGGSGGRSWLGKRLGWGESSIGNIVQNGNFILGKV